MNHKKNLVDHQGEQVVDYSDLITHIPVGVCKFMLDDKYTLIYGNQALYNLFGYTPEQFKEELNNELIRNLLAEESDDIKKQLSAESPLDTADFRLEHRVTRRDGTIIWILVSGNFTTYAGAPAANGIVVDITEQKQLEEQLRIDEERFRLALAQTDSTIFDYNIVTKVMMHSDKAASKYGLSYETKNVPNCLVQEKVVHPDSAESFLEMYRKICEGAQSASCIIKARTTDERYVWQRITLTTIYDQFGTPVRAVGVLEDIDEQTRREALLLEQSQRDTLTGLYNKGATETIIRTHLVKKDCAGAVFIIDVDSFKEVNDHYGHLFGDLVLAEIPKRISTLFRQEDVIGRIGGDEILIYLDGIIDKETALRKAKEVCIAFLHPFSHNGLSTSISCTVGLALCPADGTSFETLYQKADIALYEAKRNGKNQFCCYESYMDKYSFFGSHITEIDL